MMILLCICLVVWVVGDLLFQICITGQLLLYFVPRYFVFCVWCSVGRIVALYNWSLVKVGVG